MNSSSFLVLVGCLTGPSAKLPVVRWRREESRGQSSAYHEDSSVTPNHRGQALSGFMISARLAKTYPQTQRMPSGALPIRRDHHTSSPPLSRRTQPNTRTSLQHKRGGAAHPFTRFVPMQYALRRNCRCSAGEGTEAPRALGLAPGPPRCSELPPRVLSTAPSPLRQEVLSEARLPHEGLLLRVQGPVSQRDPCILLSLRTPQDYLGVASHSVSAV